MESQRKAAMRLFYREEAGIPDPEQLPIWPKGADFALVGTVIRELRAVDAHELPEPLDIDCPTLLLTDERGPEHLRGTVGRLDGRLLQSRVVELDGTGHVSIQSALPRVAAAVREFASQTPPAVRATRAGLSLRFRVLVSGTGRSCAGDSDIATHPTDERGAFAPVDASSDDGQSNMLGKI